MNVGPCLRDRSAFMNAEHNRISRNESLLHSPNPYSRRKKKLQTPSLFGACSPKLFFQKNQKPILDTLLIPIVCFVAYVSIPQTKLVASAVWNGSFIVGIIIESLLDFYTDFILFLELSWQSNYIKNLVQYCCVSWCVSLVQIMFTKLNISILRKSSSG